MKNCHFSKLYIEKYIYICFLLRGLVNGLTISLFMQELKMYFAFNSLLAIVYLKRSFCDLKSLLNIYCLTRNPLLYLPNTFLRTVIKNLDLKWELPGHATLCAHFSPLGTDYLIIKLTILLMAHNMLAEICGSSHV